MAALFVVFSLADSRTSLAQTSGGGGTIIQDTASSARFVSRKEFARSLAKKLGFNLPTGDESNSVDPVEFMNGGGEIQIDPANYTTAAPNIREGTVLVGNKPQKILHARGAAAPVIYQFTTLRAGEVTISATVRGGTQVWAVNNGAPVAARDDGSGTSTQAEPLKLPAGTHQLRVTLPPGGSIGEIRVDTPCMGPVTPDFQGPLNEPLTYGEKTVAMVRALGLMKDLPDAGKPPEVIPAAAAVRNPDSVRPSDVSDERGQPRQGISVKRPLLGTDAGRTEFIINAPDAGLFELRATMSGNGKTSWSVNGCRSDDAQVRTPDNAPKPFTIGVVELKRGANRVVLRAGSSVKIFDLQIARKDESTSSYYQVAMAAGLQEGEPLAPVDEGGLASNLQSVLFTDRIGQLRMQEREDLLGGSPDFAILPDHPIDWGDFQLGDEGNFGTPVSPYIPAGGLP